MLTALLTFVVATDPAELNVGGLTLKLWDPTFTVQNLTKSIGAGGFDTHNNFSFVAPQAPRQGCHSLGDVTLRVRAADDTSDTFAYYTSASHVAAVRVASTNPNVVLAHDVTAALNATPPVDPSDVARDPFHGVLAGSWKTLPDKALTCTAEEFRGSLGTMRDAADCLATTKKHAGVNYAVYRGDSDKNCYICALTTRGDPSTWSYDTLKGAVSFAGAGVLPPPPPTPPPPFGGQIPVQVVRSYEKVPSGNGFVLRFNVTNTLDAELEVGGFGIPLPSADMQHGIEQSVWHDPHIGGDHGFVEWVRVVVDEQTMLAVPDASSTKGEGFEAWRPIMENTCGGNVWEMVTRSAAWASEWKLNRQFPYYYMSGQLNVTGTWPKPKSPWPAWHANDTVPITDFAGIAAPFNEPTSRTLKPGESFNFAVRFVMAEAGPRTRNGALQAAGKAIMQAVPGYVLSPEFEAAALFVTPPAGVTVTTVTSSNATVLSASVSTSTSDAHADVTRTATRINVQAKKGGRARVVVSLSDGSAAVAHYAVVPSETFAAQVGRLGQHWSNDAWLPRDYHDPFGRSASVMPWDRENREHVLDDSRAYDVGLSDDAGGGNPLGFAMKVGHAPVQDEVGHLDDYIEFTLYGIKNDTAKPPFKSLQLRPEDGGDTDGIRMTMYYYDNSAQPSANWSGHFTYDYKEADKCGHYGIEGGPNWCMSESLANATYRAFNYPHHCASYYNMYRIARYHANMKTRKPWQWYLARAANTTIRFGAPSTGVMDGTLFREVLRSLEEEAAGESASTAVVSHGALDWGTAAATIRENMLGRAIKFASEPYPYGSEFAFDTTGQEEVVVWLMHFANTSNAWDAAAKRTVDHILSYMRSSPTWAYHGAARSWGDLGNNGKWMPSVGTASGFQTRGNFHYRSGLNAIPLFEYYRAHPDDHFLLEVAMGAQAGQLMSIDKHGAPSMMLHMLPHVLDFDPHSGDFGLGFFGLTLEAASYLVQHPTLGTVCYLCDLQETAHGVHSSGVLTFSPRDAYRQRAFIEPIAMYVQADVGIFEQVIVDLNARRATFVFAEAGTGATFNAHRLRAEKTSASRNASNFRLVQPAGAQLVRGAWTFPASTTTATLAWD